MGITPSNVQGFIQPLRHAEEVRKFCAGCETLLYAIAQNRPLSADEAQWIDRYCKEVCQEIESRLPPK